MDKFLLQVRWAYFHVNPMYVKFYIHNEAWFQHRINKRVYYYDENTGEE